MTREEALKWLKTFKGNTGMAELSQAFDVAIKALEEQTDLQYENHILSCELEKLRDEIKTLEQRQEKCRWNEEGMKEWDKLQEQKEVLEQQKKPEKVRPNAKIERISPCGDGRDLTEVIRYSCPNCFRRIGEKQQACEHCVLFFDWSKRAYIRTITTVEWR